MEPEEAAKVIYRSLEEVESWVQRKRYRAYEPFDGLSSPLRILTFGNLFLDRLLMQLIRQCPWNLRPLLRVKPLDSTKGRGYMAWGYLAMFRTTGDETFFRKARECLDWLVSHKSPKFAEFSWANHFDFASRGGRYGKDESIIVWTALIGQAFLDGSELLNVPLYREVAESVCRWILALPRERTPRGTCLSYLATTQSSIHNSNMLGAAMLARTGQLSGNRVFLDVAKEAMEYSCSRQRPDGGWWYAEEPKYHWIDNFHTGYNLESLRVYSQCTGDAAYWEHLQKGFHFYKSHFFESNGRPKYYHNRTYPVDSQCCAQAIETLAGFSELDPDALPLAAKVARWTIENMQDSEGFFYYRQYPWIKAKTPMLHWAQATTYRALTVLYSKCSTGSTQAVSDHVKTHFFKQLPTGEDPVEAASHRSANPRLPEQANKSNLLPVRTFALRADDLDSLREARSVPTSGRCSEFRACG